MRIGKNKQKRVMPENTIPLINVVFLMLIFFLIAGTVAPPVSTDLRPPSSETLPLMPPAGNAVEILADGRLIHRGQELALEALLERFPAPGDSPSGPDLEDKDADEVVHVLADRALPADKLMPVLKAFRSVGHKTIRLVTVRGE